MIGFSFAVYNRRRDGHVTYDLQKTPDGWHIEHIAINGDCKPDGTDLFYKNLEQDNINFPSGFGYFLSHLWSSLDTAEITTEEAQAKLQELADWISTCERSQPNWEGWNV